MTTEIDELLAKARLELSYDVQDRSVRAVFNALVAIHEKVKRLENQRQEVKIAA